MLRKADKLRFRAIIAATLAESGEKEQAADIILEIIEEEPNNITVYGHAAYVMFLCNEDLMGFHYLDKALEIEPTNRQFVQMTLQYGFEKDMREEAHRILSKVAVHLPELRRYLPALLEPELLDDLL